METTDKFPHFFYNSRKAESLMTWEGVVGWDIGYMGELF